MLIIVVHAYEAIMNEHLLFQTSNLISKFRCKTNSLCNARQAIGFINAESQLSEKGVRVFSARVGSTG